MFGWITCKFIFVCELKLENVLQHPHVSITLTEMHFADHCQNNWIWDSYQFLSSGADQFDLTKNKHPFMSIL